MALPGQKLIDPLTGALQLSGYTSEKGVAETLVINWEDAKPVSSSAPWLNRLQYRVWNYFLLHTPKHVIQFIFVDVISDASNTRGICPSSIIIFEKANPRDTMLKVEEATFKCP